MMGCVNIFEGRPRRPEATPSLKQGGWIQPFAKDGWVGRYVTVGVFTACGAIRSVCRTGFVGMTAG